MQAHVAFTVAGLLTANVAFGKLQPPAGPRKLGAQSPDSFKTMEAFKHIVAISDVNNDGTLECVYADRTAFNPESKTSTFTWYFPKTGRYFPLHARPGATPGAVTVTVGEDPKEVEGVIYYTDYKSCVIGDLEYFGSVCSLWTLRELKDSVPQDCIDHFVDICGVEVQAHSRDLCADGEGDY